jgi:toxin FitB
MIVIDTNVLSELLKPEPHPGVESWIRQYPLGSVFITTITEAEVLYGVALLPGGKRKEILEVSTHTLFTQIFSGRILSFDSEAARAYAKIASVRQKSGFPISQFDAQIAAITHAHSARLVTRNTVDFRDCGIEVINPWL